MKIPRLRQILPAWQNVLLAIVSGILLILAFPDWELWFLAWVALVPLLFAVDREKESTPRGFILGWIFGTVFFFGTCYWLTYAPINYAAFPPLLAYSLMVIVAAIVGVFPGLFAAIISVFLRRYREFGFLVVPFVWVFTEFLRHWLTANSWNALGYSQAFADNSTLATASVGGIYLVAAYLMSTNALFALLLRKWSGARSSQIRSSASAFGLFALLSPVVAIFLLALSALGSNFRKVARRRTRWVTFGPPVVFAVFSGAIYFATEGRDKVLKPLTGDSLGYVVAIQPNVPMSGLDYARWQALRSRHIRLAEAGLVPDFDPLIKEELSSMTYDGRSMRLEKQFKEHFAKTPKLVVFPESPMNFMYEEEPETRTFINGFAAKHNVSVLFNSAEPDVPNNKYFNSAVLVSPEGKEVVQYDKIHLVPFGEAVPSPLEGILPGFIGNFSYGSEYDLFPVGDAKAGVMICFESHFGSLSRQFVRNGADVLIEMTNDGWLGPTPVLRQHLASAVFRAVETNRPVLRVTNVGITAYINERGEVIDPSPIYAEDTRVWSVNKSDGAQTFYVRYGDWFAWLSTLLTIGLLGYAATMSRVGQRQ